MPDRMIMTNQYLSKYELKNVKTCSQWPLCKVHHIVSIRFYDEFKIETFKCKEIYFKLFKKIKVMAGSARLFVNTIYILTSTKN